MWMAKAKQATTIATQAAFKVFDLAVEIYTRPWIVEFSKKSRQTTNDMLTERNPTSFYIHTYSNLCLPSAQLWEQMSILKAGSCLRLRTTIDKIGIQVCIQNDFTPNLPF